MNEYWPQMLIFPAQGITNLMSQVSRGMQISPGLIPTSIRFTANQEFETYGEYFRLSHYHIERRIRT